MKIKSKRIIGMLTLFMVVGSILIGCQKKTSDVEQGELQTIRLNEVVRSVFYAPMYVAINEGFFEEEGLKIDLSTGQGADKTMQQLLSGNVDIGFSGPEQVIYIYNQGREDYPVVFAQLTKKDGSFLVGRESEENFSWSEMKGKDIIGARPGGIPQMALEYSLKKNEIDPKEDVNIITNIDFTATAGAFKSGTGDYVALFEPTATMLERDGEGKIVASIGEEAGDIAYTCFYTTKSYMKENPETLEKFSKGIYKGQQWVQSHTSEEIAKVIVDFFPGTDIEVIAQVIENYKKIDAFSTTPEVDENGVNGLMDIIQDYDETLIKERPPLDKIINNDFAKEAMK